MSKKFGAGVNCAAADSTKRWQPNTSSEAMQMQYVLLIYETEYGLTVQQRRTQTPARGSSSNSCANT